MRVVFRFQRLCLHYNKFNFNTGVTKTLNMPYYAVAKGRTTGIYTSWGDCEAQVKGFSGARYKKFDSAASAQEFVVNESGGITAPTAGYNYQPKYGGSSHYTTNRTQSTKPIAQNKFNQNHPSPVPKSKARARRAPTTSESEDSLSDDDISTVICKQLDDIEKRVNLFEKGIDKIINKTTGSRKKAILIEPLQVKKPRGNSTFERDSDGYVQVYTDGACSANGRKGARAGLGVYWGDGHHLNASEAVSGRATNNCGEIQAATHAIKQALQNGVTKLSVNTDSQFLINSVTKWMPGWKRKGWKLQSGEPVKNEVDFKELDSLQHQLQVKWNYVEAHRGVHGNEMADQLAKAGALKYNK